MARMETVYFSEIHSEKWFKTRQEAEDYDAHIEMVDHAYVTLNREYPKEFIVDVIKAFSDRYKIEERWEWKAKQITAEQSPIDQEDMP